MPPQPRAAAHPQRSRRPRWPRAGLRLLLGVAVALAPPAALAQVGGQAPGGAASGAGSASIFAGSMIETRAVVGATTFDKSADPTWNPSVGSAIVLAPRVRLGAGLSLSAMTTLSREFTDEDWTQASGETTLSDTFVTFGAPIVANPALGLSLSASLQLRLPTSKISLSNSMIFGSLVGVTAAFSKAFAPLGWSQTLSMALIGRGGPFAHRYTTGSLESPWLGNCPSLREGCERYSHDGVRNPAFRWQGIAALDWGPHPRIGLSLQGGVFYDTLSDSAPARTASGLRIAPDASDPSARGIIFTAAYVNVTLTDELAVAAGVETAHEQLGPDSRPRAPFYNRFSSVLIALRLFPDALAGRFGAQAPR